MENIAWKVIHIIICEGKGPLILLGKGFAKLILETRRVCPTSVLTPQLLGVSSLSGCLGYGIISMTSVNFTFHTINIK